MEDKGYFGPSLLNGSLLTFRCENKQLKGKPIEGERLDKEGRVESMSCSLLGAARMKEDWYALILWEDKSEAEWVRVNPSQMYGAMYTDISFAILQS